MLIGLSPSIISANLVHTPAELVATCLDLVAGVVV